MNTVRSIDVATPTRCVHADSCSDAPTLGLSGPTELPSQESVMLALSPTRGRFFVPASSSASARTPLLFSLPRRRQVSSNLRVPPAVRTHSPLDGASNTAHIEWSGPVRLKAETLQLGAESVGWLFAYLGAVTASVIVLLEMSSSPSTCKFWNSAAALNPPIVPGKPHPCTPTMSCDVSENAAPAIHSTLIWPIRFIELISGPTGVMSTACACPPTGTIGTNASCAFSCRNGSGLYPSTPN
mmetsp:Transcript_16195/g.40814  ORF Transcript_16195/g.40814 Transcript_16195/m.40814 type:complete len:241 (-) Transcript_16195:27-749(-)